MTKFIIFGLLGNFYSGVIVKIKNLIILLVLLGAAQAQTTSTAAKIGIDDSFLGKSVNMDQIFIDESGQPITLREASEGKPVTML